MPIQFGAHELDEERFTLRRLGNRVAIRPKVFDLLAHLVRSRERVVLRDELVMALWGTTAVGPGSLSGLVNELRQVLGESGREDSSIRTVHARGYQFVATVDSDSGEDEWASEEEGVQVLGMGTNTLSGEAGALSDLSMTAIRNSFEHVLCSGARAALVTGERLAGSFYAAGILHETLLLAGFDIFEVSKGAGDADPGLLIFDRIFEALVDRLGVDHLRPMIPIRERELADRYEGGASRAGRRPVEPLARQQYYERILRSSAVLLRKLAFDRPIALIFQDEDSVSGKAVKDLSSLLNLLGESRVFVLARVSLSLLVANEGPGELGSQDSRIDYVENSGMTRDKVNRLFESRGMNALPPVLADALVAHIRDDESSLDSITLWLKSEARSESESLPENTVRERPSKMRRVQSVSTSLRARAGDT